MSRIFISTTISKYLPRVYGKMKPLETLPPLKTLLLGYFGMPASGEMVTDEILDAMESFCKAGRIVRNHQIKAEAFLDDMSDLGFPLACGAITLAPFDLIGDTLRGLRGILMDMYRCPDKLLAAIDKVTLLMIDGAVAQCEATGCPGVFIPLHKGVRGLHIKLSPMII